MKKEPTKGLCNWWWRGQIPITRRSGIIADKTKEGMFCNNKESGNFLSQVCSPETRKTCPDYQ